MAPESKTRQREREIFECDAIPLEGSQRPGRPADGSARGPERTAPPPRSRRSSAPGAFALLVIIVFFLLFFKMTTLVLEAAVFVLTNPRALLVTMGVIAGFLIYRRTRRMR